MDYLFTIAVSIFAVEYFSYLPVAEFGQKLLNILKTALKVVTSSRISDHWKERVLIRYAVEIMKNTLYLLLILSGLLLLIAVISIFYDWFGGQEIPAINILSEPLNWLWMTFVASIYLYFRNRYARG